MMKIVPLLFLLFNFADISQAKKCNILATPKYTIYIKDEIPNSNITVRCRSKEDDLGFHNLKENQEYNFSFCQQFLGRTLFACDVKWTNKKSSFHGFDLKLGQEHCSNYKCRWSVKADGVFLVEKKKYLKFSNWTTGSDDDVRFNRKISYAKLET